MVKASNVLALYGKIIGSHSSFLPLVLYIKFHFNLITLIAAFLHSKQIAPRKVLSGEHSGLFFFGTGNWHLQ